MSKAGSTRSKSDDVTVFQKKNSWYIPNRVRTLDFFCPGVKKSSPGRVVREGPSLPCAPTFARRAGRVWRLRRRPQRWRRGSGWAGGRRGPGRAGEAAAAGGDADATPEGGRGRARAPGASGARPSKPGCGGEGGGRRFLNWCIARVEGACGGRRAVPTATLTFT